MKQNAFAIFLKSAMPTAFNSGWVHSYIPKLKFEATKSVVPIGTFIANPVGMDDLLTLGFIHGLRPERQRQALPIESHRLKSKATKSVVPYGTCKANPVGMIDFETLRFIPELVGPIESAALILMTFFLWSKPKFYA